MKNISLVNLPQFVQSVRESGYKSLAAAVSELVDNALEAGASKIRVIVEDLGKEECDLRITILDDGKGISRASLLGALQFGGTSRFNSRSGSGRFGMGLPGASLSQAKVVDIYSWAPGSASRWAHLDIEKIAGGRNDGFRIVMRVPLPQHLIPHRRSFRTAVIWSLCDRVAYSNVACVEAELCKELGRIFRRALQNGFTITVNESEVQFRDPVRIIPAPGGGTAVVLPIVVVPISIPELHVSQEVVIRFSVLPLENWSLLANETKREFGITKGAGVSVLRNDREIAYGWYFLEGKRKANYDDWWRCEICFPPALDEAFGVTHTKQGIRPHPELSRALSPVICGQAKRFNSEIRKRFQDLAKGERRGERQAQDRDSIVRSPVVGVPRKSDGLRKTSLYGKRYNLKVERNSSRQFLRVTARANSVTVYLNMLHPFYVALFEPITSTGSRKQVTALTAFLLALGRTLVDLPDSSSTQFVELMSRVSSAFLGHVRRSR